MLTLPHLNSSRVRNPLSLPSTKILAPGASTESTPARFRRWRRLLQVVGKPDIVYHTRELLRAITARCLLST